MDLNGAVENTQGDIGRHDFDGGDFGAGGFVAHGVHQVGGFQGEKARLFDLDAGLGDFGAERAHFGEGAAEGDTAFGAAAEVFEGTFGDADEAHAVVDAAGAEAALGDLEASAFAEEQVRGGDADVGEREFAVAVGQVVVAVNGEEALDLHAWGIEGDKDHGLLLVARRGGIRPAHEDGEFGAGIAGAGGPPFAAIEDVFVAVASDGGGDVCGIRGGDAGLRHAEDGADIGVAEGGEPGGLLGGGAVAGEDLHIAGIGRGAVEDLRGPGDSAHDFAEGGVFEIGEAAIGKEEIPEAGGAGFGLEAGEVFGGEAGFERVDVLVHERFEAVLPGEGLGSGGEVHRRVRQSGSGRWGVLLKV